MSCDRSSTTIAVTKRGQSWEIGFGNETLIIPVLTAEAMAQHILGREVSDAAKAALAVAKAQ
jgi:hypothetical protein